MPMEKFDLPRKDWYDDEGRIYKDRLIENFNALEERLIAFLEMSPLVPVELDWDTIDIPDVTLSSPDNKIVNLRSLIKILNLDKLPAKVVVSGKKIVELVYYYNNQRKSIKDYSLTISEGQFVWLTPSSNTLSVISASTLESNIRNSTAGMPIAVYSNGQLYTIYAPLALDYDILGTLSKMQIKGINLGTFNSGGVNPRERVQGRNLGVAWRNSKSQNISVTAPDTGYEADGQRS